MSDIRLVVFDLAGTTVHDPGGVNLTLRAALDEAGVKVSPPAVDAVMGLPKPEAIRRLLEGAGRSDLVPNIPGLHEAFVARMLAWYATSREVSEVPGASETFRKLRRKGIAVGLNTGFHRPILDAVLKRVGWGGDLVNASVASDEVPRGRPHPDMIFRLMELVGVRDVKQVAKVGDTPADLHEGTNAGCPLVVGVTQGTHTREQLAVHPHTHLIDTVADLPVLIPASVGA